MSFICRRRLIPVRPFSLVGLQLQTVCILMPTPVLTIRALAPLRLTLRWLDS